MTAAGYKVRALRPVADPLELRDATVRDYVANARRAGGEVDVEAITKLATAHLHVVDAYNRGVDVTARPAGAPRPKRPAQSVIVHPDAAPGPKLKAPSGAPKTREEVLYRRAHKRGEKWSLAMGRLRRILEGATPHRDIKVLAATATHPVLALRYLRLYAAFLTRNRVSRHNPFEGLSDRDAARKFEAEVYAICDASSGLSGPWFVPK